MPNWIREIGHYTAMSIAAGVQTPCSTCLNLAIVTLITAEQDDEWEGEYCSKHFKQVERSVLRDGLRQF